MSEDQISYLRLPIHPAIGGDLEAEWVLGIHRDWINELCRQKHLHQLGGYAPGCDHFFSVAYLLKLRADQEWMDKAVVIMRKHFRQKNSNAKARSAN